jgi:hypothetical protein
MTPKREKRKKKRKSKIDFATSPPFLTNDNGALNLHRDSFISEQKSILNII